MHPLCIKQHSQTVMNMERDDIRSSLQHNISTFNKRLRFNKSVFTRHEKVQPELEAPAACLCEYIYFRGRVILSLFLITRLWTWKAAHYVYSCLKAIHEQFTHLFFSPGLYKQTEWYMSKWTEEMVLRFHTEGRVVWEFLVFQHKCHALDKKKR